MAGNIMQFGAPDMLAPGIGQYGQSPQLKMPEVKLPTTAADISVPGSILGNLVPGGAFGPEDAGGALSLDQMRLDALKEWQGRNGLGKMFWKQDGGFDWGAVGSVAEAIGGLGQLYLGFEANKQAKDALAFQKQAYQTNLTNQTKSYNLALEDRVRARAAQKNQSQEEASQYINKHRL